ncbi:MAG: sulfotransferase [bacterium]|nr:sulfotransferase [bacterium]
MSAAKTTFEATQVPFYIRLAISATSALDSLGINLVNLDLETFKQKAQEQTGFSDWGDAQFLRDMEVFLDYARRNQQSSVISKIALRTDVMRRLTTYLKLQAAKKRHTDLLSQPITSPIIIVGLPRTGTTLLQRLLSQDPGAHGPALWELFNPVTVDSPLSPEELRKQAANFERTVRGTSLTLWSIHPMAADEADECFFLLPQSIGDLSLHLPIDYLDVFMKRSALPDYQLHKQYFQALHYRKPSRRWVWKSPLHMPKLDDMLTVYPDAHVIWCHRGLGHVVASWISYTALARKFVLKTDDARQVAQNWMKIWQVSLTEAQKARDKRPKTQFFDMQYDELVSDPMVMIQRIYRHFGMTLTPQADGSMRAWLEADKQKERPGHRYTLDQFGLSGSDLERTFSEYVNKYDILVD